MAINPKHNAAQAFDDQQQKLQELIARIETKAAETPMNPNWSHVGSLAHAVNELEQIAKFLGAFGE